MSNSLFLQIISLCLIATVCMTWIIFATIKTLVKYTDFGKHTEQAKEKQKKIQNFEDDVPILEKEFSTPTIETSFGDKRIGAVYKNDL
jgi:hypothetical protein